MKFLYLPDDNTVGIKKYVQQKLNTRTLCSTRLTRCQIFSSVEHIGYVCYTQFNQSDMSLCVLLIYT